MLTIYSLDEKTFCWGNVFAKPDAVFFDRAKNEYLVVEYKSREFYALGSLTPLSVFQLLVSAEVVKKHIFSRSSQGEKRDSIKVRSFMRLSNKVAEVKGWQAPIQHVLAMLPDVLSAHDKDTISASDLARSFVIFDKVFKFTKLSNEDKCFLGKLNHIRISKPAKSYKSKDAISSGKKPSMGCDLNHKPNPTPC